MENTYVGSYAGYTNRQGDYNVGMGARADFGNTNRSNNTFMGYDAYINNNDIVALGFLVDARGTGAVGIGSQVDVRSEYNIGIGYNAYDGLSTVNGNNIYIGRSAIVQNNSDNNILLGRSAVADAAQSSIGMGYTTALSSDSSVVIGSLSSMSGTRSIGLGFGTSVSGSNSIAIGHGTTVSNNNEVYIGNSSTTSIGGPVNWTATSDGRFKTNVSENVPGLDFIRGLRPVTYNFDLEKLSEFSCQDDLDFSEKKDVVYSGFIAQEVFDVSEELGYDFSGVKVPENEYDMFGLRYAEFVVPMVKAMQELDEKVAEQADQIAVQKETIEQQEALLKRYEDALNGYERRMAELEQKVTNVENKVETESSIEASTEDQR